MIPSVWCMEPVALDRWLRQSGERVRLGSSLFMDWDSRQNRPYELLDGGIAVIPVQGALSKADRWWSLGGSYQAIGNQVRQALDDAGVRSILLDIDSPGGDVAGVQELATILAAAGLVKPLYAWADGQCCSAAFWLASTARRLVATPTSEVGSIGVVGVHCEVSQAAERTGYTFTVIRAGKEKAFGNQYEQLSPEALASIQGRLDQLYALFVQGVAANRGLDAAQAGQWAEGKVFLAQEGLTAGLIDRVQNRDDFLASIREDTMDKHTLQAQHPELYQAVLAEGRQAASAESAPALETAKGTAAEAARQQVVALAGALGGQEFQTKLEQAITAGLTPESIAAAVSIMGVSPGTAEPEGKTPAAAILAVLKGTDAGGVAPGARESKPKAAGNPLADFVAKTYGATR